VDRRRRAEPLREVARHAAQDLLALGATPRRRLDAADAGFVSLGFTAVLPLSVRIPASLTACAPRSLRAGSSKAQDLRATSARPETQVLQSFG
jgi:hypothetical protein